MYETAELSLPKNAEKIFTVLLFLYPKQYRKKFAREMLLVFHDVYTEELQEKGSVGIGFWFFQFSDITNSVLELYKDVIIKKGMKKYIQTTFHITVYNIIGGVLLLPFFILFAIDLIARIAQGDMMHYNRHVYIFLSHTPLYSPPLLFSIAILFPILAVICNLIPIIRSVSKKHSHIFSLSFIQRNSGSLLLLIVALGFLTIIKLHDFAPCMVHGILKVGITNLPHIFSVCSE